MHVYCDLFDVLEIAERNEDFATEAPTLLLSRQVAHNFPNILTMHVSGFGYERRCWYLLLVV